MPTIVHLPPFELRVTARQLCRDGVALPLGARAFDLLVALVEARGDLVTKDRLLEKAWPGLVVEESNIHVQVSALRRLLGAEAIATVPGLGYRFALPVLDAPADGAVAPAPRHNLPAERTAFVGREAALADARERLARTRMLTLIGIGGTGKTRLARKLAEQAMADFADGVAWVDLAPVDSVDTLPAAVAQATGVRLDGARAPDAALAAALRPRHLLLVLDNCEHLTDAVARLVDTLLGGAARLTVLATSREALALPGEALLPVRPMALPPEDVEVDLDALAGSEAVRLFVQAALVAHGGFVLDGVNAPAVARICRALDGIPLALELAAAQLQVIGPVQLLNALQDRLRLLVGPRRALPRQQTLQAVIRWSHDHLPVAEQRLLAALSVCQGGCDLAAAQALAGPDASCAEVVAALSRLAEVGLVDVLHVDGIARYRLLETVRQFAMERLDAEGRAGSLRERHARHYASVAGDAWPHGTSDGPPPTVRSALRHERDNLLRAMDWFRDECRPRDLDGALRLVTALYEYWTEAGWIPLGLQRSLTMLPPSTTRVPTPGRLAEALGACAQMASRIRAVDTARDMAERAVDAARGLPAERRVVHHVRLADAMRAAGTLDAADEQLGIADDLVEATPPAAEGPHRRDDLLAMVSGARAAVAAMRGDWDAAAAGFDAALEAKGVHGSAGGIAGDELNAGFVAIRRGRPDEAAARLGRARQAADRMQSVYLDVAWLDLAAAWRIAVGEWVEGLVLLGAAGAWHQQVGQPAGDLVTTVHGWQLAALRAAHGDALIQAALDRGASLSAAVALADARASLAPSRVPRTPPATSTDASTEPR